MVRHGTVHFWVGFSTGYCTWYFFWRFSTAWYGTVRHGSLRYGSVRTTECQQAFEHLKEKLTGAPTLGYADFSLPFVLETDASILGLGAVLYQQQGGSKTVIAYASRRLRGAERNDRNYSSMKLELLALKWAAVEKFRSYLLGSKFTVLTDNNPLCHLNTAKLGAIEQRWAAQLAIFDLK